MAENDTAIVLPSGAEVRLFEVIGQDTDEVRLRHVTPEFNPGAIPPDMLLGDMTFLCENSALIRAIAAAEQPDAAETTPRRVIISIADREAEFGVLDMNVRQSFEAFTIAKNTCIWEAF